MNAYQSYQQSMIGTADPLELITMLYDGALEAVAAAREHLAAGDIMARGEAISKASAIVLELASSLDHARGGELSRRLAELYHYMLSRLTDAHGKQERAPLDEVARLLTTLREGWVAVANKSLDQAPFLYPGEPEPAQVCCAF